MHTEMDALGQSEAFLDFQESLSRVAPIDRPVLLIGERGTGKELAATRMHYLSRRSLPEWFVAWLELIPAAILSALLLPALIIDGNPRHLDLLQEYLGQGLQHQGFHLRQYLWWLHYCRHLHSQIHRQHLGQVWLELDLLSQRYRHHLCQYQAYSD